MKNLKPSFSVGGGFLSWGPDGFVLLKFLFFVFEFEMVLREFGFLIRVLWIIKNYWFFDDQVVDFCNFR